jgi:hypothetical protein
MGSIRDQNLGWLRKTLYFPAQTAQSFTITVTATGASNTGQAHTQIVTATSILQTIPGSGGTATQYVALQCTATGAGADWHSPMPYDLDFSKSIGFQVLWSHRTTGATALATATWKVTYDVYKMPQIGASGGSAGVAGSSGLATGAPATALDTVIAAQTTQTTANTKPSILCSPRGIINNTKSSAALTDNTKAYWTVEAMLSAATASFTDDVYMLGLIIDYDVRKTFGAGKKGVASTPVLQNWLDLGWSPATNPLAG